MIAYLAPHGVSPNRAIRLYREYGEETMDIVRNHPYRLCELAGIAFKTADKLAMSMGIDPFSQERLDHALLYTLTDAETKGHLCLEKHDFLKECLKLLNTRGMTQDMLADRAVKLIQEDKLFTYDGSVFNSRTARVEESLAYAYSCGKGGAGGQRIYFNEYGKNDGAAGYHTTFGDYSSEFGAIPEVGFIDPLSGNVYGGPSPDFSQIMRSGRGGGAVKDSDPNSTYVQNTYAVTAEPGVIVVNDTVADEYGLTPGEVLEVSGGKRGPYAANTGKWIGIIGGGGGGPVLNYINKTYDDNCDGTSVYHNDQEKRIYGGRGGKGADGTDGPDPFVFSKTAYGRGGIGGHGGGGGGSSAYTAWYDTSYQLQISLPGLGGSGGAGSDGAPGCILVYY